MNIRHTMNNRYYTALALLYHPDTRSYQQGYKASFLPAARVPLQLGGSTLHQGGRHQLIHPSDTEGYLPITPSLFGLAKP